MYYIHYIYLYIIYNIYIYMCIYIYIYIYVYITLKLQDNIFFDKKRYLNSCSLRDYLTDHILCFGNAFLNTLI